MKLKSKQTGEIMEFDAVLVAKDVKGNEVAHLEYNSIDKFLEEWEDVPEPKEYWYIDDAGVIQIDPILDSMINMRKSIGNYFVTKEEAEKAVERLSAWKRLKDKGFEFIGKTYETDKRFGSIFYKVDDDTYSEDIVDDLDLLFGGEE